MLSAGRAIRRTLRDPWAVGALAVLLALVAMAASAPWLAPHGASASVQPGPALPPSWMPGGKAGFLLGTDAEGRGILATIMHGTGTALLIGAGAVAVQAALGVTLGLIAGLRGGWVDGVVTGVADLLVSISTPLAAIAALALLPMAASTAVSDDLPIPALILVIGLAGWPRIARTARAHAIDAVMRDSVDAARVIGSSGVVIARRHILPTLGAPVLAVSATRLAEAVLAVAALSFLGLGIPAETPSLGAPIRSGLEDAGSGAWWIALFPALALVLVLLSLTLLGDRLRSALGPEPGQGQVG